jgi:citrate synthase
LAIW